MSVTYGWYIQNFMSRAISADVPMSLDAFRLLIATYTDGTEQQLAWIIRAVEDTTSQCNSATQRILTSHLNISTANSGVRTLSDYGDYGDQDDQSYYRPAEHAFVLDTTYRKTNAEFIMKLSEGWQLSQVAMDDVIEGCREVCKQTLCILKENVVGALSDVGLQRSWS